MWRKLRNRVKAQISTIRYCTAFIDAYEGEGWRRSNDTKLKPTSELAANRKRIGQAKARIRNLLQEIRTVNKDHGRLTLDSEGEIEAEAIVCSKCGEGDVEEGAVAADAAEAAQDGKGAEAGAAGGGADAGAGASGGSGGGVSTNGAASTAAAEEDDGANDILLCDLDGCNRAYHQRCLNPPVPSSHIPPGDADWFCHECACFLDCLELVNAEFDCDIDDPKEFFPETDDDGNARYDAPIMSPVAMARMLAATRPAAAGSGRGGGAGSGAGAGAGSGGAAGARRRSARERRRAAPAGADLAPLLPSDSDDSDFDPVAFVESRKKRRRTGGDSASESDSADDEAATTTTGAAGPAPAPTATVDDSSYSQVTDDSDDSDDGSSDDDSSDDSGNESGGEGGSGSDTSPKESGGEGERAGEDGEDDDDDDDSESEESEPEIRRSGRSRASIDYRTLNLLLFGDAGDEGDSMFGSSAEEDGEWVGSPAPRGSRRSRRR